MSPCTAKLSAYKSKHFLKYVCGVFLFLSFFVVVGRGGVVRCSLFHTVALAGCWMWGVQTFNFPPSFSLFFPLQPFPSISLLTPNPPPSFIHSFMLSLLTNPPSPLLSSPRKLSTHKKPQSNWVGSRAKPQSLFGKLEAAKKSNFGNEDVGS